VPNESLRLPRRAALTMAAVASGAVALAGCKDEPGRSGTADGTATGSGQPNAQSPSTDPVIVAALSAAATQVAQLSARYTTVGRKYPALRTKLAAGAKYHAAHLTRLRETAGVQPAQAAKLPPVPGTSSAALSDLARREKAAAAAHAAAAAKVSGPAARLLAMVAASERQLAASLLPKKAAR
jgi:hypothetical protein